MKMPIKLQTFFQYLSCLFILSFSSNVFAGTEGLLKPKGATVDLASVESRTTGLVDYFVAIIKYTCIVIGLIMVIKSLMNIAAISRGEKDGSVMMNFLACIVGGMMTSVVFWYIYFGNTSRDLLGVSESE